MPNEIVLAVRQTDHGDDPNRVSYTQRRRLPPLPAMLVGRNPISTGNVGGQHLCRGTSVQTNGPDMFLQQGGKRSAPTATVNHLPEW